MHKRPIHCRWMKTLLADNNDSVSNHQPKLFYFSFGNSLTSHNAGISANIIYSNNWKGSFSYRYYEREAKNKPSNYIPQHTFFGPIEAVDETHALSVMVGRIFPNISDICRVGFEAGPSFLYYKERHFTPESWSDCQAQFYKKIYCRPLVKDEPGNCCFPCFGG